jgi:hypothetical protein
MRTRALWLMVRPSRSDLSTAALPVVAFVLTSLVVFTVATFARLFWAVPSEGSGGYKILAVALPAVLVVPLATLGGSAARLSARRRDDRLAILRLLGASAVWVRMIAAIEASMLAATGVVAGAIVYLASAPLLVTVPVHGQPISLAEVWVPPVMLVVLSFAMIAVAAVSAISGLRQVVISPLGVRTRTHAPKVHWLRLAISAAVTIGAVVLLRFTSTSWGTIGITVAIAVILVVVMAVQNVAGPYLVGVLARRSLARASTAARLLAARGILELPQVAWRHVSGVALASFVVVPAGSVLGFLNFIESSGTQLTSEQLLFFGDIRTTVIAAVVVSFLLVACSVGINQSAAVLERRDLYVSLDRLGMPPSTMQASRRLSVMMPLRLAAIGPALIASVLVLPMLAFSLAMAPLFIVGVALCIGAGMWLVRLGVAVTTPVLRAVLEHPDRAL